MTDSPLFSPPPCGIALDEEVGESGVWRHHIALHPRDSCPGWTGPNPIQKFVDPLISTLGEYLHPTVTQVADPPKEVERARHLTTCLPVADALNGAIDVDVHRLAHQRI